MDDQTPPRPRPRARRVGGRNVWLDRVDLDLIDLRTIETEMAALGWARVESDQFEGRAESVDAFAGQGIRSVDSLNISGHADDFSFGLVSLRLSEGGSALLTLDRPDDPRAAGVHAHVEQFLRTRVRKVGRFASRAAAPLFFGSLVVLSLVFSYADAQFESGATHVSNWWLVPPAALFLGSVGAGLTARALRGRVLLVTRDEVPGWLSRNRDNLSTNLVVALVTAVVTFAVTRLFG